MIGNPIGYPIGGTLSSGRLATATIQLDDATLAATGTIALTGQLSVTLDDVTILATATIAIAGTETALLDDCTILAVSTMRYDNITVPGSALGLITSAIIANATITTTRSNNTQITS